MHDTVEIRMTKLGKDGWKEHLPEVPLVEDVVIGFIEGALAEHKNELSGSFRITVKQNGGYGKNHKRGRTIISNVKFRENGRLELYDVADLIRDFAW